jgi:predicted permease
MKTVFQDLRYAARTLRMNPGFTLVAVATLALGIGANTALFSLVDAVLLHPFPLVQADGIVSVETDSSSYPLYRDLAAQTRQLSALACFRDRPFSVGVAGRSALVPGAIVSGNYFTTLGVKPYLGRTLLSDDDAGSPGRPVAVISVSLWKRMLGGDSSIVGKPLSLNGVPFTIVGIAPEGFRGTRLEVSPDIWIPVSSWPLAATGRFQKLDIESRNWGWLEMAGRLRPGVTSEQAGSELISLIKLNAKTHPNTLSSQVELSLLPVQEGAVRFGGRSETLRFVSLLVAVTGLALLVACANLANLLLARMAGRTREIGIRQALGAGRGRLIRQLLTESMLLAVLGGAAGVLVAEWGIGFLARFQLPGRIPAEQLHLGIQPRVLLFALAASVLTGILFGLAPALRAGRVDLVSALKEGGQLAAPGVSRTRRAVVATQVALCMCLLAGAGLFLRSLKNLAALEQGFQSTGVATASMDMSLQRYEPAQAVALLKGARERIGTTPGMEASWALLGPLYPGEFTETLELEGYVPPDGKNPLAAMDAVGPGFFSLLRIPIVKGREFDERDGKGAPPVVIVNESLARTYWPGRDPIGLHMKAAGVMAEVVGLAADVRYLHPRQAAQPFFFVPHLQLIELEGVSEVTILTRSGAGAGSAAAALSKELDRQDASLPTFSEAPLEARLGELLLAERLTMTLLALFGALSLALAAVGIYGVVAFSVGQRTREIGIRIALGASRRDVLLLILREGLAPVGAGAAFGVAGAWAFGRLISTSLFGVGGGDPLTLAAVLALLAAAAVFACLLPARRAARLDPMRALRYE